MSDMASRIARRVDSCVRFARYVLGLLLLGMVALNVANAVGRHVVQSAINGADEILIFAMAWIVFLGAALVTWQRRHLSVDVIDQLIPRTARRKRDAAVLVLTAILGGFVVVQSIDVIFRLAAIGQVSMGAQIPMAVPHASIAVGFGLMVVVAILGLVTHPAAASKTESPRDGVDGPGPQ